MHNFRILKPLFLWLLFVWWLVGLPARAENPNQSHLRVVFSTEVFSSVNRNDALASFRAWISAVGARMGLDLTVDSDTYSGPTELRRLLEQDAGDCFIIDSMDYISLQGEDLPWDPYFMPQTDGAEASTYLLLTHQGPTETLLDLRGKRVIFLRSKGVNLAQRWIDGVLEEHELGDIDTFFGSAEDVTKPSAAVLPVFFGQADACVVDQASFEIMAELNPQVGSQLQSMISSPPYVETVICIHRNKVEHREELIEGLAELSTDPAGKQILLVFQIDGLAPFQDELLDSVRALNPSRNQVQLAGQ